MTPEQLPLPCQHHWRIAEANGERSAGRCIKCLAVRSDFPNSHYPDRDWRVTREEMTPSPSPRPRRRGKPLTVALGRERVFSQHWEGPR